MPDSQCSCRQPAPARTTAGAEHGSPATSTGGAAGVRKALRGVLMALTVSQVSPKKWNPTCSPHLKKPPVDVTQNPLSRTDCAPACDVRNRLRKSCRRGIFSFMSVQQGSAGNVIAALCSLVIPGLGQLVQGRFLAALIFIIGSSVLWVISLGTLGWIIHLWACLNAALWKPGR